MLGFGLLSMPFSRSKGGVRGRSRVRCTTCGSPAFGVGAALPRGAPPGRAWGAAIFEVRLAPALASARFARQQQRDARLPVLCRLLLQGERCPVHARRPPSGAARLEQARTAAAGNVFFRLLLLLCAQRPRCQPYNRAPGAAGRGPAAQRHSARARLAISTDQAPVRRVFVSCPQYISFRWGASGRAANRAAAVSEPPLIFRTLLPLRKGLPRMQAYFCRSPNAPCERSALRISAPCEYRLSTLSFPSLACPKLRHCNSSSQPLHTPHAPRRSRRAANSDSIRKAAVAVRARGAM